MCVFHFITWAFFFVVSSGKEKYSRIYPGYISGEKDTTRL